MNTPNPLMPEGSLLRPKGTANVRFAVVAIIAVHLIFFGSLLLVPGCSKDTGKEGAAGDTNTNSAATYSMPPMDTSYYTSPTNLPVSDTFAGAPTNPTGVAAVDTGLPLGTNLANDPGVGAITSLPPVGIDAMPPAPDVKEHLVQSGDSYYKIAKLYNTTVGAIAKANPNVNASKLKIGQRLQVPVGSSGGAISGMASGGTTSATAARNGSSTAQYIVKAGDTLTRIARQHGTTVKAVRQANNMRTDRVNVGQKLKIPAKSNTNGNGAAPASNGLNADPGSIGSPSTPVTNQF